MKVENIVSLSPTQEGILFQTLLSDDPRLYNEVLQFDINSELDIDILEKSFNEVIARHSVLRSVFIYTNVKVNQQVILKQRKGKVNFFDLTDESDKKGKLNEYVENIINTAFDLQKDLLVRISVFKLNNKKYHFVFSFHHIILDGWSMGIVLNDLFTIYSALANNVQLSLSPVNQYYNYIKHINTEDTVNAKHFWENCLAGYDNPNNIPFVKNTELGSDYRFTGYGFELTLETTEKINEYCRSNGITSNSFFEAVVGIMLQRYNNCSDVVYGIVVSGRQKELANIQNTAGLFISAVPLRVEAGKNDRFIDIARKVQKASVDCEANAIITLAEIQNYSELKNNLLNVLFTYENYPIENTLKNSDSPLNISDPVMTEATNYNFNIIVMPGETFKFSITFNGNVYEDDTAEKVEKHITNLINDILSESDKNIVDLEIVGTEERALIIDKFNDTNKTYEDIASLQAVFENTAKRLPDKEAVFFMNEIMTYRKLNVEANKLAHFLKKNGVKKNTIVPIIFDRSFEMIISIYAIIKAGGAYLPISPSMPVERVKYIIDNCDAFVVIVQNSEYIDELGNYDVSVLTFADKKWENESSENPDMICGSDDLAYVIYTSGSTGVPKGVMIEHRSIINRLQWMSERTGLDEAEMILQKTPYTFDVSVVEMFWWAFSGASMVLLEPGMEKDPIKVAEAIEKYQVTYCHFVPSMLKLFLDFITDDTAEQIKSLKKVVASGEELSFKLADEFKNIIYNKNKTLLYNFYGPTEAAVDVTYYDCFNEDQDFGFIPIGLPIANVKIYVLNDERKLQPVGVPGEIYISGVNVGRGYVKLEEENEKRFVCDPFCPGNRMYRTGDIGVWMKEGFVKYIGRCDKQVKIRGLRIELGDIENVLLHHEKVNEAAIICTKNNKGDPILGAYYTSNEDITDDELKIYLKKYLIDYMIPSFFLRLEKMPLNQNGKLNVKSLPVINVDSSDSSDYIAPENELEKDIAKIWESEIGVENVSCKADIFELGGHSIIIMRIIARMKKELGISVAFKDFMEHTNIRDLCAFIEKNDTSDNYEYPQITADIENRNEPFPLTDVQMSYLIGRSSDVDMGGVSTHLYLEIETELDINKLQRSINKVIAGHDMMRCVIDGNGFQRILKDVPEYKISINDISGFNSESREKVLLECREKYSHHIFDTAVWPLFAFNAAKISENKHILFVEIDPIIADARSMFIVGKEIMDIYNGKSVDAPVQISFRDYMKGVEQLKESDIYKRDKAYWQERLDSIAAAPQLPMIADPSEIVNPHFSRLTQTVDKATWHKIKSYCAKIKVSPIAFLLTCFSNVLGYWSNEKKFTVNFTVSNRYPFHKDIDRIVGDFTSLMLVEVDCTETDNFEKKIIIMQKIVANTIEHRHYDGVEIIRDIARHKKLAAQAIMPIVFTGNLSESNSIDNPWELFGKTRFGTNQTSQVYLDNQVVEFDEGLQVTWDYVDALFDKEQISNMFGLYVRTIADINNQKKYTLSEKELEMLRKYNSTEDKSIKTGLIHELFMSAAEKYPDNKAVELDDEFITYRELDEMSNQAANWFNSHGVKVGDRVCIAAYRDIRTIAMLLGILKSGAAYIPVDYALPESRKEYIKKNSDSRFAVDIVKKPEIWEEIICESREYVSVEMSETELAYIIYTSGSTGNPKGVLIEHRSAVNTIIDINKRFNITESDRIIGISSMGFDLSVYDIFGSLFVGALLVLVKDQKDIPDLIRVIDEKKITVWNSVPALMDLVVDVKEYDSDDNDGSGISEPLSVFESQKKLFVNKYDEEIPVNREKLADYKHKIHSRNYKYSDVNIPLVEDKNFLSDFMRRKSVRDFDEETQIPFELFSKLMSVFKQFKEKNETRYCYASAGGLYPIDIYLSVKENRVGGISKGLYYFNPKKHTLQYINNAPNIDNSMHFFGNREIYDSSAVSVFLVYNAEANMPKYGTLGYFQACLDAGIMIQMFTDAAEKIGMGVCSIGNIDTKVLKKDLPMTKNQVLMHTIEIGLKKEEHISSTEDECVYPEIVDEYEYIMNPEKTLSSLRLVMLSGDYIPLNLPDRIRKIFKKASVISLGGATEGSIWSIYYPIGVIDKKWKTIPYGYPLANQHMYVLNEQLEDCPVGVRGEICIGGIGVAKGYDNNSKQTSESFIHHDRYGYIYKTGDYGIMTKEGYIEFIGRKDMQVKIRGMRIELEEIESILLNNNTVNNAKAVVVDTKNGKEICLYYVSDTANKSRIDKLLRENLPVYMIPKYIVDLDSMPLTVNGKVDVKNLPHPESISNMEVDNQNDIPHSESLSDKETVDKFVEVESDIEKQLSEIWCELLEIDKIDVNQNFFELGGNSVTLIKAHSKVDKLYKGKIKLVELFNYPTIKQLAEEIRTRISSGKQKKEVSTFELGDIYKNLSSESNIVNVEIKINDDIIKLIHEANKKYQLESKTVALSMAALVYAKASGNSIINMYLGDSENNIQEYEYDFNSINSISSLLSITSDIHKKHGTYSIDDIQVNIKKNHIMPFIIDENDMGKYRMNSFTNLFTYVSDSDDEIVIGYKFDESSISREYVTIILKNLENAFNMLRE